MRLLDAGRRGGSGGGRGEKERNGGREGSPYRADEVPGRGIVDEDVAPLNSESEKKCQA